MPSYNCPNDSKNYFDCGSNEPSIPDPVVTYSLVTDQGEFIITNDGDEFGVAI